MGFNKKYLSEKFIRIQANNNDYKSFYKYFNDANTLIIEDKFSSDVFDKIRIVKITDKNRIIEIMNECQN